MDVRSSDGILNLRCSSDDYGKPNMSRISQHMEGNLRIQFDLIVGVSDWVTERSSGASSNNFNIRRTFVQDEYPIGIHLFAFIWEWCFMEFINSF